MTVFRAHSPIFMGGNEGALDDRVRLVHLIGDDHMQRVVPVVVDEKDRLVVITVYTFYFQEGEKR